MRQVKQLSITLVWLQKSRMEVLRKRALVIATAVQAVWVASTIAQEAVYQVKGSAKHEVLNPDGSPFASYRTYSFVASVNRNQWLIQGKLEGEKPNIVVAPDRRSIRVGPGHGERVEIDLDYGSDGVDYYGKMYEPNHLVVLPNDFKIDAAGLEKLKNTQIGFVGRGPYPEKADCLLRFVWTAFASRQYLISNGSVPAPWASVTIPG